jgi:hypothetical protein
LHSKKLKNTSLGTQQQPQSQRSQRKPAEQVQSKLPRPKRAQWDKSRSETPNEQFMSMESKRAQWNKAREEMDLMYYNFEMKTAQFAATQRRIKQQNGTNATSATVTQMK